MHLPLLYLSLVKFCFRSGQSCKSFPACLLCRILASRARECGISWTVVIYSCPRREPWNRIARLLFLYEYGYRALCQHLLRLTAQQHSLQSVITIRRHHDEIEFRLCLLPW